MKPLFVSTVTASRVLEIHEDMLLCDPTAGNITLTLPPAQSRSGKWYWVMKLGASANTVTIDGHASETVNGAASFVLALENDAVVLVTDDSNWHLGFHGTGYLPLSGGTMTGPIDMDGNDITDVGRIGINMPTPLKALHITAVANDDGIRFTGSGGASLFQLSQSATDKALMVMRDGATVKVRISSNPSDVTHFIGANFGIGATPSDLFHVSAAGDANAFRVDDTTGNTLLGTGLDRAGRLQIVDTAVGIEGRSVDTDATSKAFRIGTTHYTNVEQVAALLFGFCSSGSNQVHIGGGTGTMNAATILQFYAAANTITTTGTEMARVTTAGLNLLTHELLQARYPVATISSTDTLDDTHEYVAADATSAAFPLNLPAVSSFLGKHYRITKINSNANAVTLTADGSDTINGVASIAIIFQWDSLDIIGTAAGWIT